MSGMGQAGNLLAGQPGGGLAEVHRRIDSILELLHQVVPNNAQPSSSLAHQPQGATAQHLIAPSVAYPPPTSTYIPPRPHVGLPLPPSATITSASQLIARAQPAVDTTLQLGYASGEDPRSHTRVLGVTTDDDIVRKIRRGAFIELGVLSKSAPSPSASSTYNLTLAPPPPPKPFQPSSFSEWLDLFLVYMTIRMGQAPAEGPALTTYVARIKELSRREPLGVWLAYDREHRKLKAVEPELSWTKVHHDLLYPCQPTRPHEAYSRQPFHAASEGPLPAGACPTFFFKGWCEKHTKCPQKHLCGHCQKPGHSSQRCFKYRQEQGKPRASFTSKPR